MSAPTVAPPSSLWDLGTEALNGRDGDTAREAGEKYNGHQHQTSDVQDAINGAASPSASNVFATMADVVGGTAYQGGYDAATNTPDLDTSPSGVSQGDMYTVTVAGTFFTIAVEVGDVIISEQDNPTLEAHWTIVNRNIDDATTTTKGIVELATDGESSSGVVVQGNDSRLSDARTPTTHASSHTDGTDDIQDATASQKGLMTSTYANKLDNIEASADVTDEANVKTALNGATISSATVAGTDKVLVQDVDDSDNLKTVTAQSIADLGSGGGVDGPSVILHYTTDSASQSPDVDITDWTEVVDSDSAFATGIFTVPAGKAGKYMVTFCARYTAQADIVAVIKTSAYEYWGSMGGDTRASVATAIFDLAVSDTLSFQVSGGTPTIDATGSGNRKLTYAMIQRIGT